MEFAFPLTSPRESRIGLCGKDAFMFRQATRGCCLRSTLATWCSWCWCKDAGLMPPGVQGWSSLSYNLSLLLTSTKSGFVMIIIPGTYQCQSLGFTKGWSKAICFLTAAYLLQKHGLVEEYRDKMPSQFQSFCLLKGMVVETAGSEIDRTRANRGYFGLASASTLTYIYIYM